jgi:uncharacterized RDD family membrane protein YckC
MTTGPEAGYYADPSIPGYIRYWDGTQWVEGTSRPAHEALKQQQPSEPEPPRTPEPQFPPQIQQPEAPHWESAEQQSSVATMIVPSAYGSRNTYGSASPFDAIPGLYRGVEPAEEEPESQVRVVELASAGSRILARIIDLAIAAVLSAPVTVTLMLLAHRHDHAYVDRLREQATTTYRTLGLDALGIALWVAALLVVLATAIVFEGYRLPRTGQTIGRRLVGVQVITVGTAENPSGGAAFSRALLFWLLAVIPVLDVAALGGVLWGRPYRQGLHEKLSGSLSIKA